MVFRIFKVLLVLPAVIMAPIGCTMLAIGHSPHQVEMLRDVYPDYPGWQVRLRTIYFIVCSAVGLTALVGSAFFELRAVSGRIRWALIVGLLVGFQLAGFMLSRGLPRQTDEGLLFLWLVGGPTLVGMRAVYLLLLPRKEPNKAPEPTPGSVTPHADA